MCLLYLTVILTLVQCQFLVKHSFWKHLASRSKPLPIFPIPVSCGEQQRWRLQQYKHKQAFARPKYACTAGYFGSCFTRQQNRYFLGGWKNSRKSVWSGRGNGYKLSAQWFLGSLIWGQALLMIARIPSTIRKYRLSTKKTTEITCTLSVVGLQQR